LRNREIVTINFRSSNRDQSVIRLDGGNVPSKLDAAVIALSRVLIRVRCEYFIDPILFYGARVRVSKALFASLRGEQRAAESLLRKSNVGPVQAAPLTRDESLFRPACVHQHSCIHLSSHWTPLIAETSRKARGARVPRVPSLGAESSSFVIGAFLSFSLSFHMRERVARVNARIAD